MRYTGRASSANHTINVVSNNGKVVDFLSSSQLNREFIPSYSFNKKTSETAKHSLLVETIASGKERIENKNEMSHIVVLEKNLYLPDLTFFLLSLFSKIYMENNSLIIHSCALEHKGSGFLVIGGRGDGKKELTLAAAMKGAKVASCENTVICLTQNGRPQIIDGTRLMHVSTRGILDTNIIESLRLQGGKNLINEEDFEQMGIKQIKNTEINYVFYAKITPGSGLSGVKQLFWPDNLLRFYGSTGSYLAGSENVFISMGKPFPNFETKKLRAARLSVAKRMCENTLHFEVCGEPNKAFEFMDSLTRGC